MDIFKGQNLLEVSERFKTNEDCKSYLSEIKWKNGFHCRRCLHIGSQKRKDFSRTCNLCSDTESAGAGTLFQKVKFGLRKAFFTCFEMSTSTKSLLATQMGARYGVTEKTARLFMHRVREAMSSMENNPIDVQVDIDEFVLVGREKPCEAAYAFRINFKN